MGGAGGAVSAPLGGDWLLSPLRYHDEIFQNNTQVTGSLCTIYKYVRCSGTVLCVMGFLGIFSDAIDSLNFSLLLTEPSPKPRLGVQLGQSELEESRLLQGG